MKSLYKFPVQILVFMMKLTLLFSLTGSRLRFRGNSNSNNPNLMYQDKCDRRIRSVGGSPKDSLDYSRDSHGGSSRDGDRSSSSSSSYRDRSSRDGGRSYGSSSNSYDQYQNNSSSSRAGSGSGGGVGQAPPPSGLQPLMAQQFNPPQPMMGLMGHSPFQFAPPPPPSSGRK